MHLVRPFPRVSALHCNPSGFARAAQIFRSRFDPCRLERQVKEIGWLDLSRSNSTGPLPVHPAGESDFLAMTVNGEVDFMRDIIADESDSPARQAGRGRVVESIERVRCRDNEPNESESL